jgi:hypothetical protein
MTEQEKILDSPEGVRQMRDEVKRFFKVCEKSITELGYRFPDAKTYVQENKYLHGGFNYVFGNCTLVTQHHIPSAYRTDEAMLSIALWDLIFGNDNLPVDDNGMPNANIPNEKLLKYTRYGYTLNEKLESAWTVFGTKDQKIWSTEELIAEWIELLIEKSDKS